MGKYKVTQPINPEVQVVALQEYKSVETDLLTLEQAEQLDRSYSDYIQVTPTRDGLERLTANSHVGTIVLDDLHIIIQPKTKVQNLFYMLTYVYDLPEFRSEETFLDVGEDIFEFIVTIFLKRVQKLIRQGLHRSYIEYEENEPYLRGRLLVADHLRTNLVNVGRFQQRTIDYTADVLENQILKYTLWLLSQVGSYSDTTLSQTLRRTYSIFAEVNHKVVGASDCRSIHFNRLNQRYQTPINLAALLLQRLSLEGNRGSHRFGTYLFDMNQVFEKFVASYMQAYFQSHPYISVATQENIWLDEEKQEKGIPDIVIRHHGQPRYVLDTKYKRFDRGIKNEDRNQMWIYSDTMQVQEGILIYPDEDLTPYSTTYNGIPLRALSLHLGGNLDEFKERCQHFAEQFDADEQGSSP